MSDITDILVRSHRLKSCFSEYTMNQCLPESCTKSTTLITFIQLMLFDRLKILNQLIEDSVFLVFILKELKHQ